MTRVDIIALIEKNRPCIEAAMREADLEAYMNTSFKYEIHLLRDGNVETRERLASDDWWRSEDQSIYKIACYCYQYYDPLEADMDIRHLVREICKDYNMGRAERAAYWDWLQSYKEENGEYPDEYERLGWVKKKTSAYESAYRSYVVELVNETDYATQLDSIIGDIWSWEDMGDE